LNRACTPAGVIDQPSDCTWQVTHERPFVPSDAKNGFEVSIGPLASKVSPNPVASFDPFAESALSVIPLPSSKPATSATQPVATKHASTHPSSLTIALP
jgi:hypothetical protein